MSDFEKRLRDIEEQARKYVKPWWKQFRYWVIFGLLGLLMFFAFVASH